MKTDVLEPSEIGVVGSDRARYEVLDLLAEGPSAAVLKARDRELGEIIVLKVLAPEVAADPLVIERLKSEIRLARRVRHPNVARVYDLESWDGRLCISMELIEGRTLNQRRGPGPMPLSEALPLLTTISTALRAAHDVGVVHRDLKPANVIVDAADRPFLLDFGIALGPGASDAEGVLRGSPGYMAAERWNGLSGLPASDLYSLGVLAYELITGERPFLARELPELMEQHRSTIPPLVSTLVREIPPELEELIARLLRKSPAERPTTVETVRALRSVEQRVAPRARSYDGTVLVVEDDKELQKLIGELFSRRGLNVVVASDGHEAIAYVRNSLPDLILLDVGLPGLDGLQTLRILKDDIRTASRPVVMLSGSENPMHPILTRGLGAAAFLNKPVNIDVLDLLLDRYLGD